MHAKYQCSIFNTSEDMSQVKVFVTDRGTDEWVLMSPAFAKPNSLHCQRFVHFISCRAYSGLPATCIMAGLPRQRGLCVFQDNSVIVGSAHSGPLPAHGTDVLYQV